MSDRLKTQMQTTGRADTVGLSAAEVVSDLEELGLDPRAVMLIGTAYVLPSERAEAAEARAGGVTDDAS